ncbi:MULTISPECIES: LysR family transcriptional regulator [Gordonia]|uniref:LysR family transcriptional regulator n=2 Tax=Gordonia paraffinivorans TaxID=175628 RepID=A0ABQ0IPC5_9ACTN|nr:LysR family transcriptional regulator [Gordonia paraffinivorans]MBY4574512.1 LysR family transcriptional regulator [Gordonia paraffinivorans]MCD2144859.1 LysR family transcriptional regulator [Gordonia paraffinivorans]PWD41203.1 LysR family transcriptional regulator [Gordonia paraffinivorans]VFA88607.1 HTH-type transcriptional regulator gltC [Gordonia paraffinivorans]GAC85406.1 putative LysR family transcriptional regulator [Gordonia paraffinivorans NBRC 108238]
MEVRRLRLLREFADRGSIGAVAEALHMTPSAVSQQMKVLADEAGVPLFEPDGRGLRLTEAGHALVLRADEVIAAVERAQEEMASYRSGKARVRLAMFPSGSTLLLPSVLDRAALAGIEVDAFHLDVGYADAAPALADFDIVVTHRDERTPAVNHSRVRVTELMREPVDVIVPLDSPLGASDRVTVSELAEHDWISVEGGFPVDDVLQSISAVTGVAPRVTQRMLDFTTIEALVAGGHGIALMPRFAVRHPAVKRLELKGVRAARVYEALSRPRSRTVVERVVEQIAAAAAEHS